MRMRADGSPSTAPPPPSPKSATPSGHFPATEPIQFQRLNMKGARSKLSQFNKEIATHALDDVRDRALSAEGEKAMAVLTTTLSNKDGYHTSVCPPPGAPDAAAISNDPHNPHTRDVVHWQVWRLLRGCCSGQQHRCTQCLMLLEVSCCTPMDERRSVVRQVLHCFGVL